MAAQGVKWPKITSVNNHDAPLQELTSRFTHECMSIRELAEARGKQRASASYVGQLATAALTLLEKLQTIPTLHHIDSDLKKVLDTVERSEAEILKSHGFLQEITKRGQFAGNDSSPPTTTPPDITGWLQALSDQLSSPAIPSGPGAVSPLPIGQEELRVRVRTSPIRAKEFRACSELEVVRRTNRVLKASGVAATIKAMKQLRSGDVELYPETAAQVERLRHNADQWVHTFGEEAMLLNDSYTVMVHSVPTSRMPIEGGETNHKSRLIADNAPFLDGAKIVYLGWLSKKAAKDKKKSTVTVAFSSPEDGNVAIHRGINWEGSHHSTERYLPELRILMCRRCSKYGHIEKQCSSPAFKCPRCSGDHRGSDCPTRKDGPTDLRCPNCNGQHTALDETKCEIRKKELEKITVAKKRPKYFTCHRGEEEASDTTAITNTTAASSPSNAPEIPPTHQDRSKNRGHPKPPANAKAERAVNATGSDQNKQTEVTNQTVTPPDSFPRRPTADVRSRRTDKGGPTTPDDPVNRSSGVNKRGSTRKDESSKQTATRPRPRPNLPPLLSDFWNQDGEEQSSPGNGNDCNVSPENGEDPSPPHKRRAPARRAPLTEQNLRGSKRKRQADQLDQQHLDPDQRVIEDYTTSSGRRVRRTRKQVDLELRRKELQFPIGYRANPFDGASIDNDNGDTTINREYDTAGDLTAGVRGAELARLAV